MDVQPHCTIRTDNEYAASDAFRQAVGNEEFILETTAPDTSHQNGMGERPHQTLKERVRCLLYCAAFGIEFWSDGLSHSVWLYNRTFHCALDMSPYEAYTKQKPTVDGLLTFVSRIVAKKAKQRNNATDPNAYDGVFLGNRATMDNILSTGMSTPTKSALQDAMTTMSSTTAPPQNDEALPLNTSSKFILVPPTLNGALMNSWKNLY
jgi:hypothetical protein